MSLRRAFNEGLTVEEYRPADRRGIDEMLDVYELAFGEGVEKWQSGLKR